MAHQHHHVSPDAGDKQVFIAVVINLALTVAQIIGGIIAGSLALIADAIHNLSDAISLIIAFAARKIARRPSDGSMTFGYGRVEVVAALVNYTTLIVIGIYLVYEGILRLIEPQGVDGWLVVIIAAIALVIDTATAFLTYRLSKTSVNIRAAFLHNIADALGSIAVIVAGTLILLYDWRLVDPLVTLLIAGYILWQSFAEIGPVIHILMLGSPPDIETDKVLERINKVDGIAGVHHAHFWQMDENRNALDAHIIIEKDAWTDADTIKQAVKSVLREDFEIAHTTLEMECFEHACIDTSSIGHPDAKEDHDHPEGEHDDHPPTKSEMT